MTAHRTVKQNIVWAPQPGPQDAMVNCPVGEIFFGGARGGGKTDAVIGKYAIKGEQYGKGFNAIFFRRELPMADDAIERSQEIMGPLGWKWNTVKSQWTSPRGARLRFRPLERVADAMKYQGQNVSDACVEEAGQYPDSRPIDRLNGILRSATGVPTQLLLTGNPGGPGQGWIRERYIDPAPGGMKLLYRDLPDGSSHQYVFIPSKLQNNRVLLANDPQYVARLHLVGNPELVRAWLEGDWHAVEGAFFDCWSDARHVCKPFKIPEHWGRFRAMDWGSAKPFSVGWYAVASEAVRSPDGKTIPRGCMVKYREWYGSAAGQTNVGLKLTAEQVGKGIAERQMRDEIGYCVGDPAMWAEDGGPSLAERVAKAAAESPGKWRRADNKRVATRGAMGGWDQMRNRLVGNEDGHAMLVMFDTCADSIRTIPLMVHDDLRVEDVDTSAEDHAADETRYACMSRPYTRPTPEKPEAMKGMLDGLTMNRLWQDGMPIGGQQ